jgi:hypothetical protein
MVPEKNIPEQVKQEFYILQSTSYETKTSKENKQMLN